MLPSLQRRRHHRSGLGVSFLQPGPERGGLLRALPAEAPGRRSTGLGKRRKRDSARRLQVRAVTRTYQGNSLSRTLGMTAEDREGLKALAGGFGPDLHWGVANFTYKVSTTG